MMRTKTTACLLLFVATLLAANQAVGRATDFSVQSELPNVQQLYNAGLYDQALRVLNAAMESKPKEPSLYYWAGRCFYELRDFARAIPSLERATALDPGSSDYHDWLGRAYGRRAEESNPFSGLSLALKAHREFTKAVHLNPSNLAAQRDLINYLLYAPGFAGGGEKRAEEQIQALAMVDAVEGDLALAEAYATHKKFDQANEIYQKLLQTDPPRIGVALEIADYYRDRGDGERMGQAVDAAAAVNASDMRLNYYRGVLLVIIQKDAARAEKLLRVYLDLAPNNSELPSRASAHEWLGRLYELQHKLDSAAEQYQAGLALAPRSKALREGLKRVLKK
jgi:tetratricopeptide (TPR) repeat protein